ncbi:MAG: glycine zipper 2TM domain-containing protein [Nevskiales bacterium]
MNKLIIAGALAAPLAVGAAGYGGYKIAQNDAQLAENDGFAELIAAVPVSKQVQVPTSSRECSQVPVTYSETVQRERTSTPTNVIVGGLIGGVIGNQVVNGSKRDAATVVGAATGGYLGYERAKRKNAPETVQRVRYEERCRTVKGSRSELQPDGYDVTYRYQGQVYTTRMQTPPAARFPVTLNVQPVTG